MPEDAHRATSRRGQSLRGSGSEWAQRRLAADLSISELAVRAGVPRSVVGLIDQGRLIPSLEQARAILGVLGSDDQDRERAAWGYHDRQVKIVGRCDGPLDWTEHLTRDAELAAIVAAPSPVTSPS